MRRHSIQEIVNGCWDGVALLLWLPWKLDSYFLRSHFPFSVGCVWIDSCQHERNNGAATVATTTTTTASCATASCATAATASYDATTPEGSPIWEPKVSIFFFSTLKVALSKTTSLAFA